MPCKGNGSMGRGGRKGRGMGSCAGQNDAKRQNGMQDRCSQDITRGAAKGCRQGSGRCGGSGSGRGNGGFGPGNSVK